jgi:hypothetical protein
LIVSISSWRKSLPLWRQTAIVIVLLFLTTGIGYGTFEDTGNFLIDLPVPLILLGRAGGSGTVSLGALLVNKFGLETQLLRRMLPAFFGFGLGVLVLLAGFILLHLRNRKRHANQTSGGTSTGYLALVIFLVLGFLLSSTILLGGGYRTYDCAGDVIASNRSVGEYLANTISPGSLVYWRGGLSAAPLLYLPGIRIYPPQINDGYSFFLDGDPDKLLSFGYWNRALDQKWLEEADYLLIEDRSYSKKFREELRDTTTQLPLSPLTVTCHADSSIRIFERKK